MMPAPSRIIWYIWQPFVRREMRYENIGNKGNGKRGTMFETGKKYELGDFETQNKRGRSCDSPL